jgi:hypothetical protein
MRKPAIPSVQPVTDRITASVLGPMKENIEILTGVRGGMLEKVAADADIAAVVERLNAIIDRLNATG